MLLTLLHINLFRTGLQWRTGSEFSTGHGELKGTLLFTNTEGFKCISAKGALFQQKGGPFA